MELAIVAVVAIFFLMQNKGQQQQQLNTSGINNSYPSGTFLYPIAVDNYVPTSIYSGFGSGQAIMMESPPSPAYYNSSSWGWGNYVPTVGTAQGYTSNQSTFGLLSSMFGG